MFRLFTPRQFGGLEADLLTVQEVTETLGQADGSAAWLIGAAATSAWAVAHGTTALQEEVFGSDPDARLAGGGAGTGTGRRARGGRSISGRWPYATGSPHASWALVLVTLSDEDSSPTASAFAVLPMADVHLADTWHTSGPGTGSNTIITEDVFVPDHRLILAAFTAHSQSQLNPLYRLSFRLVGGASFLGSLLGLGSAALTFVLESAPTRPSRIPSSAPRASRWACNCTSPTPRCAYRPPSCTRSPWPPHRPRPRRPGTGPDRRGAIARPDLPRGAGNPRRGHDPARRARVRRAGRHQSPTAPRARRRGGSAARRIQRNRRQGVARQGPTRSERSRTSGVTDRATWVVRPGQRLDAAVTGTGSGSADSPTKSDWS